MSHHMRKQAAFLPELLNFLTKKFGPTSAEAAQKIAKIVRDNPKKTALGVGSAIGGAAIAEADPYDRIKGALTDTGGRAQGFLRPGETAEQEKMQQAVLGPYLKFLKQERTGRQAVNEDAQRLSDETIKLAKDREASIRQSADDVRKAAVKASLHKGIQEGYKQGFTAANERAPLDKTFNVDAAASAAGNMGIPPEPINATGSPGAAATLKLFLAKHKWPLMGAGAVGVGLGTGGYYAYKYLKRKEEEEKKRKVPPEAEGLPTSDSSIAKMAAQQDYEETCERISHILSLQQALTAKR